MATIKLKNLTTGMSKIGALVKVHPTNKAAFEYITDISTLSVIGTVANSVSPGSMATINLINNQEPSRLTISNTPPATPKDGDLWIDSSI
jgi:hypothetical protein